MNLPFLSQSHHRETGTKRTSQPRRQIPPPSSHRHRCTSSRPRGCDSPILRTRGHSTHTPSPPPQTTAPPRAQPAGQEHWQSPLLGQRPRFPPCRRCRPPANRTAPSASPVFLPPLPAFMKGEADRLRGYTEIISIESTGTLLIRAQPHCLLPSLCTYPHDDAHGFA